MGNVISIVIAILLTISSVNPSYSFPQYDLQTVMQTRNTDVNVMVQHSVFNIFQQIFKMGSHPSPQNLVELMKTLTIENIRLGMHLNDECLWNIFFSIFYQSTTSQNVNQMFETISNLSEIITQSPFNPITFQTSISHFYSSLIRKFFYESISQTQLVSLLKQMLKQTNIFGMSVHIHVWNQFFFIFYKLPNHYRDGFIHTLLGQMQCKPDVNTFNIILFGLATNPGIKDRIRTANLIIHTVMMELHQKTPNQITYRSQFRAFVNGGDIKAANNVSLVHPDIFYDGDIESLNDILTELPKYNVHICNKLGEILLFLMNKILSRFKMVPNIKTYRILEKLYTEYPAIYHYLTLMHPYGDHEDIHRIVRRLQRITFIKNSTGYKNYAIIVPEHERGSNQYRPKTPNPIAKCSENVWFRLEHQWEQILQKYDQLKLAETSVIARNIE